MIRADYCGDGTSHTRDGTAINILDRLRIQKAASAPTMSMEALWSPDGAVCIVHARVPGTDIAALERACPTRLAKRTGPNACRLRAARGSSHCKPVGGSGIGCARALTQLAHLRSSTPYSADVARGSIATDLASAECVLPSHVITEGADFLHLRAEFVLASSSVRTRWQSA